MNTINRDTQWQVIQSQSWGRSVKRMIELEGGDMIEAVIYWREESEEIRNEYGVKYNKRTGSYNPCLHLSYWKPAKVSGMMSSGLGDFYPLPGSEKRRTIKPLIEQSNRFDADKLQDLMVSRDIKTIF